MECKYKLPCNWCEKFDKQCSEMNCSCNNTFKNIQECEHDWMFYYSYSCYEEKEKRYYYRQVYKCRKCGITKIY